VAVTLAAGDPEARRVWIMTAPPIDAAGRDPRELNEEVRTWIEYQIAALAPTQQPIK